MCKVRCPICDNNIECPYCDEIMGHEEELKNSIKYIKVDLDKKV